MSSQSREDKAVVQVIQRVPSPQEYLALRRSVGWHPLPEPAVRTGLKNSLYAVCALSEERVIGCGRISGDGGIYFYIQDLIVRPDYQHRELGARLMDRLMAYIHNHAQHGAFVGLMSAPGLEGFYERFGFRIFPEDSPGMMIWK